MAAGVGNRKRRKRQPVGPKNIGGQLERRVSSGAIDMAQAKKVAGQRQTLRKAYGKDWRNKVYGDTGYARRTRTALAKNPTSQRLQALNKQLMERRKRLLKRASA